MQPVRLEKPVAESRKLFFRRNNKDGDLQAGVQFPRYRKSYNGRTGPTVLKQSYITFLALSAFLVINVNLNSFVRKAAFSAARIQKMTQRLSQCIPPHSRLFVFHFFIDPAMIVTSDML